MLRLPRPSSVKFLRPLVKSLISQAQLLCSEGLEEKRGVPLHQSDRETLLLSSHSLAGSSTPLIGVWPTQCSCDFWEPVVRAGVGCEPVEFRVPIHVIKEEWTYSLQKVLPETIYTPNLQFAMLKIDT